MATECSLAQARRFLLYKHGLLGTRRFAGGKGILDYVAQVGCVQYDPVDVCGKSHELAFLARIEGFTREMLFTELYEKRTLIDFFDKNMSILRTSDWKYLEPVRAYYRERSRSHEEIDQLVPSILETVHERGCVSSQELGVEGRADWYWSETTLSRAALETLYLRGELIVHHKKNAVKSYALASDCLPAELLAEENPLKTEQEQQIWQAKRRIGAVGMLWNAPSDAWLCIGNFNAEARGQVFDKLLQKGEITALSVEGIAKPLYLLTEDVSLFLRCGKPFAGVKKARFLPPLDCALWDRKLIIALFGFSYKWEIYTPLEQRKYAYYVLPVLYGERFAGRVEPVCDRKRGVLVIKRFWAEADFRVTDAFVRALEDAAEELRAFHGSERVEWSEGWLQDGASTL